MRPCDKIARIAKRSLSIAPYFDVSESPRNWINNSTVDLIFDKRLLTDGGLND